MGPFHPLVFWIALILTMTSTYGLQSQEPETGRVAYEVAIEPSAVLTAPIGSIESVRGSLPCSNTFGAALSVNPAFGIRVTWVTDTRELATLASFRLRGLSISGGWDDLSSRFVSRPVSAFDAFDPGRDDYVTVETEHDVVFTMAFVRAALGAEFAIGDNLLLRFGPNTAFPLSARSVEGERILRPGNATFLDGRQEREIPEGTGSIDDAGLRLGIECGIGYRLPLGGTFYFEPSVMADAALTTIQPSWAPLVVRIGIALGRWARRIPPPPPPPPPPVARQFAARLSVSVVGRNEPITFRRQIVARYIPILPTVFFGRQEDHLRAAYMSLGEFREESLPPDAEMAHTRTLDVFGQRLRDRPGARVAVTGTTSGDESERMDLARARAESVADYLATRWGIARGRIDVLSRTDPQNPSNPGNTEGLEENRRVEISFSDDEIYRPVQLRTVEPITDPAYIRFAIHASANDTIRQWQLTILGDGDTIAAPSGQGIPPAIVQWDLTQSNRERILNAKESTFGLAVYDSLGRIVGIQGKLLPIRVDTTVSVTTLHRQPDARADFLLVTFDFDRAELTRRGREELRTILRRIGPESRVEIIGYTDPIGDVDHNRRLALARAKAVADEIPAGIDLNYRGAAPDEAPYSSSSPEGRFLSRTVRVIVENPR